MRRSLFLVIGVFLLAASSAFAHDAVKADPSHYSVIMENSRVRVVKAHYGPHEKSVMHSHPNCVAIFQTDGRVKFTFPGGKTEERDTKAGTAMWTPAVTHLPENLTDGEMEVILVEMKTPKRRPAKKPATVNKNANQQ